MIAAVASPIAWLSTTRTGVDRLAVLDIVPTKMARDKADARLADDMREVDLIGLMLEEAGSCPPDRAFGPERRIRLQVLQILKDLRRIEDLQLTMYQHWHLSFRIDP